MASVPMVVSEIPVEIQVQAQDEFMGRGQNQDAARWDVYRAAYRTAYAAKRDEALASGMTPGMARYAAKQHATREATKASGLQHPSGVSRDPYY